MHLKRGGEYGRLSGHSDTSVGNSVVMAFASYDAILKGGAWEETYKALGLDMKIKFSDSCFDVTFLKGMWYDAESGPVWGPLPSRILKAGKSLRDPRDIYGIADFEEASIRFLSDVALGHGYFLQVPILRQFVENYAVRKENKSLVQLDVNQKYKTQASGMNKRVMVMCWGNVCRRYNTDMHEIEELEAMMPSTPFQFVQHPLFNKLAIDYV